MTLLRMEHLGIVVDDLAAATEFFLELGLEVEGSTSMENPLADRMTALDGVRCAFTMMRTPDGHGCLELIEFHSPPSPDGNAQEPTNALGLRHVLFVVEDIHDVITRLKTKGAEPVGELVNYEDMYWLCYLRGPAGIIVELAEKIA
jgi:catechol 2,3-dioxygenase-like lactoylglutathione lyase family enzyme